MPLDRDRWPPLSTTNQTWQSGLRAVASPPQPFRPSSHSPNASFVSARPDAPAFVTTSPSRAPPAATLLSSPQSPTERSRRDVLVSNAPALQHAWEQLENGKISVEQFIETANSLELHPGPAALRLLALFAKNGSVSFTAMLKSLMMEEDSAVLNMPAGGSGKEQVGLHFYKAASTSPRRPGSALRPSDPLGLVGGEEPRRPARKPSTLTHVNADHVNALVIASTPSPTRTPATGEAPPATPPAAAAADNGRAKAAVHDAIRRLCSGDLTAARFVDVLQAATGRAPGIDVERALARFTAGGTVSFREMVIICAPYFAREEGPQDADSVARRLGEMGLLKDSPEKRPFDPTKTPPADQLRMYTQSHTPEAPAPTRIAGDIITWRGVGEGRSPAAPHVHRPPTARLQTPSSFDLISGRVDSAVVRHSEGLDVTPTRPAKKPVGESPASELRAAGPSRPVTAGCGDLLGWQGVDARAVEAPAKASVHPRSAVAPHDVPFATNYG